MCILYCSMHYYHNNYNILYVYCVTVYVIVQPDARAFYVSYVH